MRLGQTFIVRVVFAFVLALSSRAFADNYDTLAKQLENDDSEKVRLAAALNITKLGDPKGVLALAKAVGNDSDKSVRGAAAVGLGKLAGSSKYKSVAINALKKAADNDESDFVKQMAKKALDALGAGGGTTTTTQTPQTNGGPGGGIYVNIGPMSSKTGSNDAKLRALMVKVATQTMAKTAPSMSTSWPGGAPNKASLASKGVAGFYVDGTLNELKVKTSSSGATISCKVSMLLADFPDKSVFGFLNGGASVTAGTSQSDQDMAGEDCVQAVIENLIANKIIPTIKTKVP